MAIMIIDGKTIASQIQEEIKQEISGLNGRPPCLAVILVGNHPPSEIYVNRKTQACADVGMRSLKILLPEDTSEKTLLEKVEELNRDDAVDGILVQMPLPSQINPSKVIQAISPEKDV